MHNYTENWFISIATQHLILKSHLNLKYYTKVLIYHETFEWSTVCNLSLIFWGGIHVSESWNMYLSMLLCRLTVLLQCNVKGSRPCCHCNSLSLRPSLTPPERREGCGGRTKGRNRWIAPAPFSKKPAYMSKDWSKKKFYRSFDVSDVCFSFTQTLASKQYCLIVHCCTNIGTILLKVPF